MLRILIALLLLAPAALSAQNNSNYDPDYDGDGCYSVTDILGLLPLFDSCSPFSCGDSVLFDNYWYETVLIGDQCWFAENLRTSTYGNGDVIPADLTDDELTTTTAGATTVYGEGNSYCHVWYMSPDFDACNDTLSLVEYGRLYNWYAVNDVRGLCPSGWHVPTDGEWAELENYVSSQGFEMFQQTTFTPICSDISSASCEFTFHMNDAFGDGWNGWSYDFLQNGQVIASETLSDGDSGSAIITLDNFVPCTILVNTTGEYPEEVSWVVSHETGFVVARIESQASSEGTALKSTAGWTGMGNGTDDFGFAALPGGHRGTVDGSFVFAGSIGAWWSSSPNGGWPWSRCLANGGSNIGRGSTQPGAGYSVRCLKDIE